VLTANKRTQVLSVTDGLSNTLMIGESAGRHENWIFGAKSSTNNGQFTNVRGAWAQESNNIVCAGVKGPLTPGQAANPVKVTAAGDVNGAIGINGWNQGELYSFHPGVCVVAMGDGSVRTLRASISLATLQKLASGRDGQPVNPDE